MSEKSCNFALFLSNLYCVKFFFMNNKDKYSKYIYRPYKGSFFCDSRKTFIGQDIGSWLHDAFVIYNSTYVEFLFGLFPAKAFKDKHGNIILRIFHENINQLSLDFIDDYV